VEHRGVLSPSTAFAIGVAQFNDSFTLHCVLAFHWESFARGPGMRSDKAKQTPKSGKAPETARPRKGAPVKVPSILLEGDLPSAPPASGPGQRYALGQPPRPPTEAEQVGELPEAYGTKRLLLTARDPHWVYAHWDLTREQLRHYNGLSADGHLVLRVHKDAVEGKPCSESHVHPESRNWFVNVPDAGARYLAELGYYAEGKREWVSVSISSATLTPPDTLSEDVTLWFETLPAELQLQQILQLVRSAVKEHVPLMEALQQLRASGLSALPTAEAITTGRWTPDQERALGELIQMDAQRRVWMGSLEITELIRRQLQQELYSAAAAQFGLGSWSGALVPGSWSGALASVFSPFGMAERRKGFWFNVNAELIIYGATEPDAEVTIGGRVIKLRPDGTFSYRFALPDGEYELPIVATSADRTDGRSAALSFKRATEYRGDVGKHPQDPRLRPPRVENVG